MFAQPSIGDFADQVAQGVLGATFANFQSTAEDPSVLLQDQASGAGFVLSLWGFRSTSNASAIAGLPIEIPSPEERKFVRLRDRWRVERAPLSSSLLKVVLCASYQEIIGMGPSAIPFILNELGSHDDPEHWFWALSAISGVNPVPAESRGKTKEMATAWLTWGLQNGYLA